QPGQSARRRRGPGSGHAHRAHPSQLWSRRGRTCSPSSAWPRTSDMSRPGRPGWDATTPWGDAFISLTLAAEFTERVRLGPSLIPLIITDPLTLAKQAATLDVYSEGRLELGIGAGWLVEEAQALGRPTDHRLGRLEETIEILR